jgi:hypothetical protein
MNDLQELRAALIQLAKALETERACVLRVLRVIERQAENKPVTVSENDTVVTAAVYDKMN